MKACLRMLPVLFFLNDEIITAKQRPFLSDYISALYIRLLIYYLLDNLSDITAYLSLQIMNILIYVFLLFNCNKDIISKASDLRILFIVNDINKFTLK